MAEPKTRPQLPDPNAEERAASLLAAWQEREDHPGPWADAWRSARTGPSLHAAEIVDERWLLLAPAGAGPLVQTWSAWDLDNQTDATLKVLDGRHAEDPAALQAFNAAEGKRGSWQGFETLARQGLPGTPLEAAVADGLAKGAALQAVVEAGAALAGLHAVGIVHGLVGPEVIRLGDTAATLDDIGLNTPASSAGTPWLAPEMLDPTARPTPAADAYGLAMSVLFSLNGGELPFWAWRNPERLVDSLAPPAPAFGALKRAVQWDPVGRSSDVRALVDAVLMTRPLRHELATAAIASGNHAIAASHLAALLSDAPDDPSLLSLRATALQQAGEDATDAWLAALDAHHTRTQAIRALTALTATEIGLRCYGADLLDLLVGEERTGLLVRLGTALLDAGDDEAALPLLSEALDAGQLSPELAARVHALQTQRGDWADVVRHLRDGANQAEDPGAALSEALHISRMALRDTPEDLALELVQHTEDADALRLLAHEADQPLPWLERLIASGHASASDRVWHVHALDRADRADEALTALVEAQSIHPVHVGLASALARRTDQPQQALERWTAVLDALSGSGHPMESDALHGIAGAHWLMGDIDQAARAWHTLLDLDTDDRKAWWGLVKVAWRAPEAQPWLASTPSIFTPEEALARLLCGLLDTDAVQAWLGDSAADLGPLGRSALLVDRLEVGRQVGPGLFTALNEHFPEAALAAEAVRWLWCEPPAEPLFAIPDSYAWTGQQDRFDRRIRREIMHLGRMRITPTTLADTLQPLLSRGSDPLPIEEALARQGTPAMAPERPSRWVAVLRSHDPLDLEGARASMGGGDTDSLQVEAWGTDRVVFDRLGEQWYLLAPEGAHLGGSRHTERRLVHGQVWSIDGLELRIFRLAQGESVPEPEPTLDEMDDLELQLEDELTVRMPHAKLVHRDGRRHSEIHFIGRVLAIGPDPDHPVVDPEDGYIFLLRREDDGSYSLEDTQVDPLSELPPILPLQHGDTFEIEDRSFSFERAGMAGESTPANPIPASRVLPILIRLDQDNATLPILDDVFSIGRGQGNDLWLPGDGEVSRQHCMLVRGADGACVLRDNGSANGTYVNGRAVERHILQVGDVIQVGAARLEFRLGRREEVEGIVPDTLLEEVEEGPSSRADTMAFRKPIRKPRPTDP